MAAELLVILAVAAPHAAAALEARTRVLQRAGSRVFIVEASDPAALESIEGIQHVGSGPTPSAANRNLSDEESLFVDAWNLRKIERKSRKGDGLDWDHSGFDAP